MKVGKFALKRDNGGAGARNIAGAASAGSMNINGAGQCFDYIGVLSHGKIIV